MPGGSNGRGSKLVMTPTMICREKGLLHQLRALHSAAAECARTRVRVCLLWMVVVVLVVVAAADPDRVEHPARGWRASGQANSVTRC